MAGKSRMPLDFYPTSQKLTEQLLLKYPISKDKVILEPCSGKGHISNYLNQLGYLVITNDIDTNQIADTYYDATNLNYLSNLNCDVVLTNPPFNVATEILANSLDIADEVIMLLRLSFLEGCKSRRDLLNAYKDNLVKVIPISPRPCFKLDSKGSDSVTVAWFIWNKQFSWKQLDINYPFDFITNWK